MISLFPSQYLIVFSFPNFRTGSSKCKSKERVGQNLLGFVEANKIESLNHVKHQDTALSLWFAQVRIVSI